MKHAAVSHSLILALAVHNVVSGSPMNYEVTTIRGVEDELQPEPDLHSQERSSGPSLPLPRQQPPQRLLTATASAAAAAGRAQPHPSCRLHHSVRTQEPLLPNSRGTTFAQIPVDDSVNYVHTGVYTEAFVMSWTNLCEYSFRITNGAGQWIKDSPKPNPVAPPLPSATQSPVTIGNGRTYEYVSFDKLYISLIDSAGGVYAKVLLSIHTDGTTYGLWAQPSFLHSDGKFYDFSNDFDFVVDSSQGKNAKGRLDCVITCPKREIAHIPQTWAYSGSADGYSTWGLDYGSSNWELVGEAAVQIGYVAGSGSRAWPVALCESMNKDNALILGEPDALPPGCQTA